MSFKIGDVVSLKSGGPCMTVIDGEEHLVTCAWFEGKKEMRADYPVDALQPDTPGPKF